MTDYTCKVCNSKKLHKVLDLGSMPSANNFATKEQISKVKSYPLAFYWCEDCTFFQQVEQISREELFGGVYAYNTGVSRPMVDHYDELAKEMKEKLPKRKLAVVVASNDGTEIASLKKFGGFEKVVGVEPAKNLAKIANDKGLTTINDFFGTAISKKMVSEYGNADLVVANNVFAHIPDPVDMLMGMKELINDDGKISVEVHWLKSLVDELQIDALYGEHYYVWSIKAMDKIAERCGLNVIEVKLLEEHGGSIRVMFGKTKRADSMPGFFDQEKKSGLYSMDTMGKLQERANERKRKFVGLVKDLKSQNKRISVWTVPAKIVTILNFCDINNEEIECAYDSTPDKIGKYIPKANILIKNEMEIEKDMPDYLIVGAWNYIDFGKKKLEWYGKKGGKLINPLTCEIIW